LLFYGRLKKLKGAALAEVLFDLTDLIFCWFILMFFFPSLWIT
jgi:hypothetical protein